MADEASLRLRFKTSDDKYSDLSFRYAKTSAAVSDVQALGNAIIANTSIYKKQYKTLVSAEYVVTSTTPIELNS